MPWLPSKQSPPAAARVVHIGEDPLHRRLPMRSFPSDLTIAASCFSVLQALEVALDARSTPFVAERDPPAGSFAPVCTMTGPGSRTGRKSRGDHPAVADPLPARNIDAEHESHQRILFRQEYCPLANPGSLFALSNAGGLGWGFPASLGVKLASPGSLVLSVLGDGATCFPIRRRVITSRRCRICRC